MENRRQTYRHAFEPELVLRAELCRPGERTVLACEVLDLSLGGFRARLREMAVPLCIGDFVAARLLGRDAPTPIELHLSVPSQVVSLWQSGEEWHCGIRFLPSADPRTHEALERTLSRFLLAEQRRRKEANQQR